MGKTSKIGDGVKTKTEGVLRSRITPEKNREQSPSDPFSCKRSGSWRSDGTSPIDLLVKAGRLGQNRRASGAFFSSRAH